MSANSSELLRQAIEAMIAETRNQNPPAVAPMPSVIDDKTREQIAQLTLLAHKPYLTRKEAALYANCSERSISEWTARASDKNPFPECAAGDSPRYKREHIDEWLEREAQGRRLKLVS